MSSTSYAVRLLGPEDIRVFDTVVSGVFDHPIDAARTAEFLADPRHHIAVALSDDRMIGSATGFHHLHPDQPPSLFIIEVAVAPTHRRQGVGKALLKTLLQHARSLGCANAWVGTEVANQAAQGLYSSSGADLDPDDFVTYTFDLSA